jgi:hypothetical protein
MCRTFPPFQFHFTKELSKISLTQLCCRLLQEKTSKLGVKLKNASKLVHFQLSPCFLFPLSHLHYVHYDMCFQQEWGTCHDFPILQKN